MKIDIYVDLSDTIRYLAANDFPSGIQKIVFGTLSGKDNFIPCIFLWSKGLIAYPVSKDFCTWTFLKSLLDSKGCSSELELLEKYPSLFRVESIEEQRSNIYMFLAGPWNYINASKTIGLLSRKNDVFFYIHDLIPFNHDFSKEYSSNFVSFFNEIKNFSVSYLCSSMHVSLDINNILAREDVDIVPFPVSLNLLSGTFSYNHGMLGLENDFYFLSVGAVDNRKRHEDVVSFWLREKMYLRYKLFIVGPYLDASHDLNSIIDKAKLVTNGIDYLGLVDEVMYLRLLASAQGVIYPSTLEGFGLPVLEAYALNKKCYVPYGANYLDAHPRYIEMDFGNESAETFLNKKVTLNENIKYAENWHDFCEKLIFSVLKTIRRV